MGNVILVNVNVCCYVRECLCRDGRGIRSALDAAVATAPMSVLGRAHEAVILGVGARGGAEALLNLAVLVAVAHPALEVAVQLAAGDAAFAAVDLALDAELVEG